MVQTRKYVCYDYDHSTNSEKKGISPSIQIAGVMKWVYTFMNVGICNKYMYAKFYVFSWPPYTSYGWPSLKTFDKEKDKIMTAKLSYVYDIIFSHGRDNAPLNFLYASLVVSTILFICIPVQIDITEWLCLHALLCRET